MAKLTCVRQAHREGRTYEEFLEARKAGFGGSDIGDLLDSEPYGCRRRLFLSRLGILPDGGDDRMRHHLERGKFFEGPVAGLYTEKTGRKLGEIGTGYLKQFPYVRANADRLVSKEPDGSAGADGYGVLEIKCPAAWSFKKIKKEGLPESYILQLQWQMLCYGASWGSFAVYWPDGHELLWFDVERDEALIATLFERARKEWGLLEEFLAYQRGGMIFEDMLKFAFPGKHEQHRASCARCPAFELCHGIKLAEGVIVQAPELEDTARAYSELVRTIRDSESQKDALKQQLKDEFAKLPCDKIIAGRFEVGMREQARESLSPTVKEVLTAEQIVKYTKRTEFETLTVKETKK